MAITFSVLGTQLEFHEDLKKYYALSCEFQAEHGKTAKTVQRDLSTQKEPSAIFEAIEASAKKYIAELINRLSNFGVFDRVASDYLNGNNGYLQIITATTAYYEYAKATADKHTTIANANLESANASINSSITGLDFGIISSSIIDHAVYAAMNKSEIRKQSLAAIERYNSVYNTINTIRDTNITIDISDYYANTYIPTITAALTALYGHLLSTYANDLNACGQLDLHCLDNVNVQRSNEIIDNIGNVDNKQGVFLKALELCPYNLNVYFKGYSEFMLPQNLSVLDVCGDIIKYFSLEKALNNIIVSVSSLCDKAKQYIEKGDYYKAKSSYDEIASAYPKQHFGWLGLLMCETKKFTNPTPDINAIENYYSKAMQTADNADLRRLIQSKYDDYKSNALRYSKLLKEKDEIMHKEALAQAAIEAARKDSTKWKSLTIFFGIMAVIALVILFVLPKSFALFLVCAGITAATAFMYNDSKKTITTNEAAFTERSAKEKQIGDLRNKIIKGVDISDIF